jgi:hypothetical protein
MNEMFRLCCLQPYLQLIRRTLSRFFRHEPDRDFILYLVESKGQPLGASQRNYQLSHVRS